MVSLDNNSSNIEYECNKCEPDALAVAEEQARDVCAFNSCFVGYHEKLTVLLKNELQILVTKGDHSPVVNDDI